MKNTIAFVIWICVLLSCEILACWNSDGGIKSFETSISRGLLTLVLAFWYYKSQEQKLTAVQKSFLLTLLIPLIFGFSRYIIPDPWAIKVNAFFYFSSFVLWIIQFKWLGAEFNISKFPISYFFLIPIIFSIPFLYYFFVLLQMMQNSNE